MYDQKLIKNLKKIKAMKIKKTVPKISRKKAIEITMIWKVEYYKSDIDRLRDIKTVDEFDNFESAKDFTIMKIGNNMGAVRLIHPDVD